jgi:hypothetical protein
LLAQKKLRERYPHFDPLVFLAHVAQDEEADQALRVSAAKELACYIYPKRKALEVTGEDGGPVKVRHRVHVTFGDAD